MKNSIGKLPTRSYLFVASCLVTALALTASLRSEASKGQSKGAVTVPAAGRGQGLLNLQEGREAKVEYRGDELVSEALRTGVARPLALAFGDFDAEGAPDLVSGYGNGAGGIVSIQRGNPSMLFKPRTSTFTSAH